MSGLQPSNSCEGKPMEVQKDFKELLALLNAHKVEYLIVGAYALSFHGIPRYTGDIDVYVKPTSKNARRVLAALREFGFGSAGMTEEDFCEPDRIAQLGHPPVRIDLMTSLTGLSWDEAFAGKVAGSYGNVPVWYIGKEQMIANKRSTKRLKDLADLETLENE